MQSVWSRNRVNDCGGPTFKGISGEGLEKSTIFVSMPIILDDLFYTTRYTLDNFTCQGETARLSIKPIHL